MSLRLPCRLDPVNATKEGAPCSLACSSTAWPCPSPPRWHDDRLWFSNWGTRQIVAVDLHRNSEVVEEGLDGRGAQQGPSMAILTFGTSPMSSPPTGSAACYSGLPVIAHTATT
jgi:hypothetical protein